MIAGAEQCGGDREALERAWGRSFFAVLVGYALLYVLFVTAVVLSLGAVMLERTPPEKP